MLIVLPDTHLCKTIQLSGDKFLVLFGIGTSGRNFKKIGVLSNTFANFVTKRSRIELLKEYRDSGFPIIYFVVVSHYKLQITYKENLMLFTVCLLGWSNLMEQYLAHQK